MGRRSSEKLVLVPSNIGELLTPVGLAFLIQDDGTFSKINGTVTLCVESFSQSDVESLMAVTTNLLRKLKPTFVWIFDLDEG
jgi:hypothetical protein